ncbi:MAG: hypothetical protein ABI794_01485 [Betaproteobacteria bacterium]
MAMSTLASSGSAPLAAPAKPLLLRGLLLAGCAIAAMIAATHGHPDALLRSDPELARLLRGIALVKVALLAATLALVAWRFRWPVKLPFAASYVVASAMMAGATALIWQLTRIPVAAVVYHAALLSMLVTMLRDDGGRYRAAAALFRVADPRRSTGPRPAGRLSRPAAVPQLPRGRLSARRSSRSRPPR